MGLQKRAAGQPSTWSTFCDQYQEFIADRKIALIVKGIFPGLSFAVCTYGPVADPRGPITRLSRMSGPFFRLGYFQHRLSAPSASFIWVWRAKAVQKSVFILSGVFQRSIPMSGSRFML